MMQCARVGARRLAGFADDAVSRRWMGAIRSPAQPARIGGKLGQGGRHGAEQHLVERSRGDPDQSVQLMRQGEHRVEVWHRQQFASPLGQPGFLGAGLALRAMPVAAGVIEVARRAAGIAGLDVATECRRAATEDGAPDLGLGRCQPLRGEIRRGRGGAAPRPGPGGGPQPLSRSGDRAARAARWCRSGGSAPDAGSAWWC